MRFASSVLSILLTACVQSNGVTLREAPSERTAIAAASGSTLIEEKKSFARADPVDPDMDYSKARLWTFDPDDAAPSAMQELSGQLLLVEDCIVLETETGGRLLLWRDPAELVESHGTVSVRQSLRLAPLGSIVRLTGTGAGRLPQSWIDRLSIPSRCRPFPSFLVNGIL